MMGVSWATSRRCSKHDQPLVNLGKLKIDGGELEITPRPVRTLQARLGFLNSTRQAFPAM
jgi:hypothetical protein